MCSWCYAFSNSLLSLKRALPVSVGFVKVVGGLAPDTMEPMPLPLRDKIQQTWHQIERTVPDVRFNFDFWLKNTPMRSTYPACRAVLTAKKQGNDCEDKMIEAIQMAYYRKAQNPSLPATLLRCAERAGLNLSQFAYDFVSEAVESDLQSEIGFARRLGVVSFPSLRLEHLGTYYPIEVDYLNPSTMLNTLSAVLAGSHTSRDWRL